MLVAFAACKPSVEPSADPTPTENSNDPSKEPDASVDPPKDDSKDPSSSEDPKPGLKVNVETGEALDVTLNRARLLAKFTVQDAPDGFEGAECFITYGTYDSRPKAQDILKDYIEEMDLGSSDYVDLEGEAEDLSADTKYYYLAWARVGEELFLGDVKSFTTKAYGDYAEAVDLGLKVKWCSINIGAMEPTDEGLFFSWGEIVSKTTFDASTYKFCTPDPNDPTIYDEILDYTGEDGGETKTKLRYSDDAAYKVLGRDWRMPTVEETKELVDNCSFEFVEDDESWKVTGPNGNCIYLPHCGYWDYEGRGGYMELTAYWTSEYSLVDYMNGYVLLLDTRNSKQKIEYEAQWFRCDGLPVRAVYKGD